MQHFDNDKTELIKENETNKKHTYKSKRFNLLAIYFSTCWNNNDYQNSNIHYDLQADDLCTTRYDA